MTPTSLSDDTALLRLCADYHMRRFTKDQLDEACDQEDDDQTLYAAGEREYMRVYDLIDQIMPFRPATLEGLFAKAIVACALLQDMRDPSAQLNTDERFISALLHDVVAALGRLGQNH